MVANLGDLAVGQLALAGSRDAAGRRGRQVSLGVQRSGRRLSAGLSLNLASQDFQDLASLAGNQVPRRQVLANLGLSLGRYGSLGVVYAEIIRSSAPPAERFLVPPSGLLLDGSGAPQAVSSFQPAQRSRLLSATWSLQLEPVSLYATGFRDFARQGGGGLLLGVTMPLGMRSSAYAGGGMSGGQGVGQGQLSQTASMPGQWGYRVGGGGPGAASGFAEAEYRSPWGLVGLGGSQTERTATVRGTARGGLALLGGEAFASNTLGDSFAVVDTDGIPRVRVSSENRPAGVTDNRGRLLVPNLLPFQANRIALEPLDLPFDANTATTSREVRPQYRAGVLVRFPVRGDGAVLLRLVDSAGRPLPLGSIARLAGRPAALPVGHDGEVFVEAPAATGNLLTVERRGGGRCRLRFDFERTPGRIERLGPLRCEEMP